MSNQSERTENRRKPRSALRRSVTLRFNEALYASISESADRNLRSMAAEVEHRLLRSVDQDHGRGGPEFSALLDYFAATSNAISAAVGSDMSVEGALAREHAFRMVIERYLQAPLEAARAAKIRNSRPPQNALYQHAMEARLQRGALRPDYLPTVQPEADELIPPALLAFYAEPPTRVVSDIQGLLIRRANLETASVPVDNYELLIGTTLRMDALVLPDPDDATKVLNGATDALNQEYLYGLKPRSVTDAEWAWAKEYDSYLRPYAEINAATDQAMERAYHILLQVEEKYGFRVESEQFRAMLADYAAIKE